MAPAICGGPTYGSAAVSEKNQRTYKVSYIVEDATRFGPATALTTAGLPSVGDVWIFDDDIDSFAICNGVTSCEPLTNPALSYKIEYVFQTPEGVTGGCAEQQQQAGSPLTAPPRPEIHWDKFTDQAQFDRFGTPLQSSSHEPISGPTVEYDDARGVITVTQNVPNADIAILSLVNNKVNSVPIFGLPPRWVKLTVESLQQKTYGSCYRYYERRLRLEVRYGSWDRYIRDVGTKAIDGHWQKNATNEWEYIVHEPVNRNKPSDFIRYKDPYDNYTKVILDGNGAPWVPEPVDNVTDCPFCAKGGGPRIPITFTGAPLEWRLLNIFDSAGHAIILGHTSGCTWTATDIDGNTWQLFQSGVGTGAWSLDVSGGGESATWILSDSAFSCSGANTLTSDTFSGGAPSSWQADTSISPNTSETTDDCASCSDPSGGGTLGNQKGGAPSIFRVSELTTAGGETIKLTHTSACNWDLTDGSDYYLLEYIDDEAGSRYWSLSVNLGTVQWIVDERSWNCQGPNTLSIATEPVPAATPPWPDYVTVVAGNKPGVRRTEFYHSVDFEAILGSLGTL